MVAQYDASGLPGCGARNPNISAQRYDGCLARWFQIAPSERTTASGFGVGGDAHSLSRASTMGCRRGKRLARGELVRLTRPRKRRRRRDIRCQRLGGRDVRGRGRLGKSGHGSAVRAQTMEKGACACGHVSTSPAASDPLSAARGRKTGEGMEASHREHRAIRLDHFEYLIG